MSEIVVLENGDAVLLHTEEHTRSIYTCDILTGGGITATTTRQTLRSIRITPDGVMTSAELHSGSSAAGAIPSNGYWPFASATGTVLAPLSGGEALVQWNTIRGYQITDGVPYPDWDQTLARLGTGGGVQATRPFAGEEVLDVAMSTSGDDFYMRHSPYGMGDSELKAIDRQTLGTRWATGGVPVQGLDNGGLQLLQSDAALIVLQERDLDGALISSHPTSLVSPVVALRDQGVVHGIANSGGLEMISVQPAAASVWSFLKGLFSSCTDAVLKADDPTAKDIGLVPTTNPYTFDFKDVPQPWSQDRKDAVTEAFATWQRDLIKKGLPYRFMPFSPAQHNAALNPLAPQADILLIRILLPLDQKGNLVGGDYDPTPVLQNRRATKALIRFNSDTNAIDAYDGYLKVGLHEVGHGLGLGHPSKYKKGGTVMNGLGSITRQLSATISVQTTKDDAGGKMPRYPTACDLGGGKNAVPR